MNKFVDSYILFCNCGVRAWGMYTIVVLTSFAIFILNPAYQPWCAVAMALGMITMLGVWYYDYAIRYIPEFWIRLEQGKNFQS